jgi:hypothetical protein
MYTKNTFVLVCMHENERNEEAHEACMLHGRKERAWKKNTQ